MRLCRKNTRLFLIISVLVLVELGRFAPVHASAAAAIILYDHGFAKQINYTPNGHLLLMNKTSTVTQDDSALTAYFTAALVSVNITWQWYDPAGNLYRERNNQYRCAVSPCSYLYVLHIAGSPAATNFGIWTLDVLANDFLLYSDHFTLNSVITQENHWDFNILASYPFKARGNLTVTIHPNNMTWTSYKIYMPYAANVTAYELPTNRALMTVALNDSGNLGVIAYLGAPRSDGFTFVLSFDVSYGVHSLGAPIAGSFAFTWREQSWMRLNDPHPIPEMFHVSLPYEATLVDVLGYNAMTLSANVTEGAVPLISFSTTLTPGQGFGWTTIYRDATWGNAHPNSIPSKTTGVPSAAEQFLPVLPLTLGSVSLWTAIMSIFLLTGSELLSPIYYRTGILINRRRLRIAALLLATIFLATTAYRLLVIQAVIRR